MSPDVQLRVRRDDIAVSEVADVAPPEQARDGEAILRVDRFGLTTNNVSYAVAGDRLGYWLPFPAEDGWGVVPAWGHATVTESRAAGVAEGEQVFGLVPMAQHLRVRPAAGRAGFADASPHRAELSPVYNRYLPAGGADELEPVLRPLFGTSVMLDLALGESGEEGPVVITSASSKTALGLAYLLRRRGVSVIGITSATRLDWVRGLDLHESVYAYDDLDALPAAGVLVDFAGDRATLARLHEQLGAALRRSIQVGFTHGENTVDDPPPVEPRPEFFFAPDEMVRRGRELGPAYAEGWAGFAPIAARAVRIEQVTGGERLAALWGDLVGGRTDPALCYVASL
jgi:hypothetical protein